MSLLWKLAWKELVQHRRLSLSFIFNLSLGLVGFLCLDAFKASVAGSLETRSRTILGADLVISSNRELRSEELALAQSALPLGSSTREERSFFTMAMSGGASRLVELRAVDDSFPYYGHLKLRQRGDVGHSDHKVITQGAWAWIYPELAIQLGLSIGDHIQLGQASFCIDDIIESDPSVSNMSFSPAPKVMIGLSQLPSTGLLGYGSRKEQRWLVALPALENAEASSILLRKFLPQSDIKIQTHRQASEQLSRLLRYLGDYLGLVALVALFLSAVGTAYLFQSFIEVRQKYMATLTALGMPFLSIVRITLLQLNLLGFFACCFSLLACYFLLPQLPQLFGGLTVEGLQLSIGWRSLGLALLTGFGGAFFFSYPAFQRLALIKPSELFRETSSKPKVNSSLWTWLPTLAIFWGLSIWQAQSFKVASIFMGVFLLAIVIIILAGHLSFYLLEKTARPWLHWIPRCAILQLCRRRRPSQACFLAIGLGSFLLILVPQLSQLMRNELTMEGKEQRPSLFLFDIQPEQVDGLKSMLKETRAQLDQLSPLIQGRLLSINGETIKLNDDSFGREAERAQNFRNRSLNLSVRRDLSSAEQLVAGRPFSGSYHSEQKKRVEASLEIRYAERLGIKIGDHFSVDVLGLVFNAEVVNFRKVRWTSFQPNFFVVFQPGVLDDAPCSYLATIIAHRDKVALAQLQKSIVAHYPNIGVVDITQTITRLLEVIHQMFFAIQVTSWVSILAALGVLFSISRQQLRFRLRDLTLLRLLGAQPHTARSLVLVEFFTLGLLASFSGLCCGLGASQIFGQLLFDGSHGLSWNTALWQGALIVFVAVFTGLVSSYKALGQNLGQLKRDLDLSY